MRRLRGLLELADGDPVNAPWREGLRVHLARLAVHVLVTGLALGVCVTLALVLLLFASLRSL